jgi:hypothetical protein
LMKWELMPFRWRLESPGSDDFKTTESAKCKDWAVKNVSCKFSFTNGDGDSKSFDIANCDSTTQWDKTIFNYFDDIYPSLKQAFGKFTIKIGNYITSNKYWEYKLSLKKLSYQCCENGDWVDTDADRVCEVNFTVTQPYMVQKSTFWLTPKSSTVKLDDYYDMKWNELIWTTDLRDIMTIDPSDYEWWSKIRLLADTFIKKYDKLAKKITWNMPDMLKGRDVRKVPNQSIYFIDGKWTITLNATTQKTPFTIILKEADLEIKWNVNVNWMFLVKWWNIKFTTADADCNKTQEVKWIFVVVDSSKSFEANNTVNNLASKPRCNAWWLSVKGVLIWDTKNIVDNRRSQLNGWFYGAWGESSIRVSRRNKIFNWASLLIEYNPGLRSNLPPGASEFTKALEVYKK